MAFYLTTKDFAVTGEEFSLEYDSDLDMLRTVNPPDSLHAYYNSPDYISHSDAKATLQDKLYHLIKKVSLRQKMRWINSFRPHRGSLLDVGAGTGDFLSTALKDGWTAFGIEPNISARKKAHNKGIRLEEELDGLSGQTFDVITLWHVLEHITRPDEFIRLLSAKLKTGGLLFVAVPNFKSYDALHYGKYWAAFDVPRHLSHFSRNSIHRLFHKIGFYVVGTRSMPFDSYYISLLSEKYKSAHGNFIRAFIMGFLSNIHAWRTKEYSSILYVLAAQEDLADS